MANPTKGYTFGASETVTNSKLHSMIDDASVTITGLISFGEASIASNTTAFIMPMHPTETTTEANARLWLVPRTVTFKNMRCNVQTAPGASETAAFTLMVNNAASALTATISDTDTSATDLSNTVEATAGETVYLKIVTSATATATDMWNVTIQYDY